MMSAIASPTPGDLHEPVFGDEDVKRLYNGCQAVGGSRVGFCPVGVAATQGGPLCVFSQETCDSAGIEGGHLTSLPSRALPARRIKATLVD